MEYVCFGLLKSCLRSDVSIVNQPIKRNSLSIFLKRSKYWKLGNLSVALLFLLSRLLLYSRRKKENLVETNQTFVPTLLFWEKQRSDSSEVFFNIISQNFSQVSRGIFFQKEILFAVSKPIPSSGPWLFSGQGITLRNIFKSFSSVLNKKQNHLFNQSSLSQQGWQIGLL